MAFNQDEFISLLTDFYEFCSRTYWDLPVQQAPSGGWPNITDNILAKLEKNEAAAKLIRHLPYPEYDLSYQQIDMTPNVMNNTSIADYRHEYTQAKILQEGRQALYPPTTPEAVCIAMSQGLGGYYVVIDTNDGFIYWGDVNGQHDEPEQELNATKERFRNDPANEWRNPSSGTNVYTPADFFAICKQRFLELRWIGVGYWEVSALRMVEEWGSDEAHDELAEAMRKAGWPGDGEGRGWDKGKFYQLIQGDEE